MQQLGCNSGDFQGSSHRFKSVNLVIRLMSLVIGRGREMGHQPFHFDVPGGENGSSDRRWICSYPEAAYSRVNLQVAAVALRARCCEAIKFSEILQGHDNGGELIGEHRLSSKREEISHHENACAYT